MNFGTSGPFPLADEYFQAVQRPADVVYDFRGEDLTSTDRAPRALPLFPLCETSHVAELAGFEDAIVIPNLWSQEECEAMIRTAETEGIIPPAKAAGTLRTAKRTDNYQNPSWSDTVADRIRDHLSAYYAKHAETEDDKYYGSFRSVHANWRIVRYDAGDTFPAHQDQMDSMQLMDPMTGRKDFCPSRRTPCCVNFPRTLRNTWAVPPVSILAPKLQGSPPDSMTSRSMSGCPRVGLWSSLSSEWSMLVSLF